MLLNGSHNTWSTTAIYSASDIRQQNEKGNKGMEFCFLIWHWMILSWRMLPSTENRWSPACLQWLWIYHQIAANHCFCRLSFSILELQLEACWHILHRQMDYSHVLYTCSLVQLNRSHGTDQLAVLIKYDRGLQVGCGGFMVVVLIEIISSQ